MVPLCRSPSNLRPSPPTGMASTRWASHSVMIWSLALSAWMLIVRMGSSFSQGGQCRVTPASASASRSGPVFVTERKARVQLPAADLDPSGRARLSYQQAEALFSAASGGATLHQLRHSALTHDAELGTGTPMLMARSGHTSVRSLVKYARVSAEALQRHQAERDPARRR